MAKYNPIAKLECWVSLSKRDAKIIFVGDNEAIKALSSQGYKFHDRKECFFKAIEVPNESAD
jgi:hypothetical protein